MGHFVNLLLLVTCIHAWHEETTPPPVQFNDQNFNPNNNLYYIGVMDYPNTMSKPYDKLAEDISKYYDFQIKVIHQTPIEEMKSITPSFGEVKEFDFVPGWRKISAIVFSYYGADAQNLAYYASKSKEIFISTHNSITTEYTNLDFSLNNLYHIMPASIPRNFHQASYWKHFLDQGATFQAVIVPGFDTKDAYRATHPRRADLFDYFFPNDGWDIFDIALPTEDLYPLGKSRKRHRGQSDLIYFHFPGRKTISAEHCDAFRNLMYRMKKRNYNVVAVHTDGNLGACENVEELIDYVIQTSFTHPVDYNDQKVPLFNAEYYPNGTVKTTPSQKYETWLQQSGSFESDIYANQVAGIMYVADAINRARKLKINGQASFRKVFENMGYRDSLVGTIGFDPKTRTNERAAVMLETQYLPGPTYDVRSKILNPRDRAESDAVMVVPVPVWKDRNCVLGHCPSCKGDDCTWIGTAMIFVIVGFGIVGILLTPFWNIMPASEALEYSIYLLYGVLEALCFEMIWYAMMQVKKGYRFWDGDYYTFTYLLVWVYAFFAIVASVDHFAVTFGYVERDTVVWLLKFNPTILFILGMMILFFMGLALVHSTMRARDAGPFLVGCILICIEMVKDVENTFFFYLLDEYMECCERKIGADDDEDDEEI